MPMAQFRRPYNVTLPPSCTTWTSMMPNLDSVLLTTHHPGPGFNKRRHPAMGRSCRTNDYGDCDGQSERLTHCILATTLKERSHEE